MTILFAFRQASFVSTFRAAIVELARLGHRVRVAWSERGELKHLDELKPIAGVTFEPFPVGRQDAWGPYAKTLRLARDYMRYLRSVHRGSTTLPWPSSPSRRLSCQALGSWR